MQDIYINSIETAIPANECSYLMTLWIVVLKRGAVSAVLLDLVLVSNHSVLKKYDR